MKTQGCFSAVHIVRKHQMSHHLARVVSTHAVEGICVGVQLESALYLVEVACLFELKERYRYPFDKPHVMASEYPSNSMRLGVL